MGVFTENVFGSLIDFSEKIWNFHGVGSRSNTSLCHLCSILSKICQCPRRFFVRLNVSLEGHFCATMSGYDNFSLFQSYQDAFLLLSGKRYTYLVFLFVNQYNILGAYYCQFYCNIFFRRLAPTTGSFR